MLFYGQAGGGASCAETSSLTVVYGQFKVLCIIVWLQSFVALGPRLFNSIPLPNGVHLNAINQ